jgi:1-acyl-sn-glycerol-3-phosphate acyltransferase
MNKSNTNAKPALSFLKGCLALTLAAPNIIFIPSLVFIFGIMRTLIPINIVRQGLNWVIQNILAVTWIRINSFIIWLCARPTWNIKGTGTLRKTGKYFLICNHQSWIDILVLHRFFGGRILTPVFFLKKQLLWLTPIVGWACWAIGYPFMKRHSKSYLKKHPAKRNEDSAITERFCERYKQYPVTIVSFLESTRFTQEKKQRQRSPYKHLLKPHAHSFARVLFSTGESLRHIINVTIIYPGGNIRFWDFICGRINKVTMRYEVISIEENNLCGDYTKDRGFRIRFQNWLNDLWQKKDELIEKEI